MTFKTVKVGTYEKSISDCPVKSLCKGRNLAIESSVKEVLFDLSGTDFFSISCTAALAEAIMAYQGRQQVSVSEPPGSVADYLSRMNFYSLARIEHNECFSRHEPHDRFIPLCKLSYSNDPGKTADLMESMLKKNIADVDGSVTNLANYAFGEIMDNVLQHSETAVSGLAAAQYYPKLGYVELVVADAGQGIAASMADNISYSGMSSDELIEKAFEAEAGQYIGKTNFSDGKASMGMGLNIASKFTRALKGYLWVVSQNSAAVISSCGFKKIPGLFYPGTVVCMKLPLQSSAKILESEIFEGGRNEPLLWSIEEGGFHCKSDISGDDHVLW